VDVALIAQNEELIELCDSGDLPHDRRPSATEPPLLGEEPVHIRRLSRPQRTTKETSELEDDRPVVGHGRVGQASPDARQQELVHQLLLEVLHVLRRAQPLRST